MAWDARWLEAHAASEGYNITDVAQACLPGFEVPRGRAVCRGLGACNYRSLLVLDRTQLAPNGGYVAVTSLVEVPPACQRLLAVADRIYAWNPRVYSLVEAALDATATKLLLAACASGPACAQGQRLKLSAEHI